MAERRTIRVFISSPIDVRPERLIAERVVHKLAREFAYQFDVEPIMWEREPLLASHHFQDLIVPPSQTDIVVTILWSRLGVPLQGEKYRGPLSGHEVTGTEWEFEDALAGFRVHQLPDLLLYRKEAEITVKLGDRAELEERQRQRELVEDFLRRWTQSADGRAFTAAFWPFADGAAFEALVEEHLRALLRKRVSGAAGIAPAEGAPVVRWHQGSPYRGLEAFEPEHEQIFFGRSRARNELRELLGRQIARGSAFVLVMGASGSGKSSLVKAGLVPDLSLPGMVPGIGLVRVAMMRPSLSADPLDALADAVLAAGALPELAAQPLDYTAARLAGLMRAAPEEATHAIRQGLNAAGIAAGLTAAGDARLLVVIDQLEEIFTVEGLSPELRDRFVAAVAALAESGLVWIVATLRSDFFARIDRSPTLAKLTEGEARYLLAPPDESEQGQIVRNPAREAGLAFEIDARTGQTLDEAILAAATAQPGALPLLEYLLDQLFTRRTENGLLSFEAYRALGGLEGAIGARAEEVMATLSADAVAALPALLRALVTVGQGAEAGATARYTHLDAFDAGSPERKLIDALLDPHARLLVADDGRIRVAHEALLTHWERARKQIAEDRHDLQLRARLEQAETRWREAAGGARDSLLLAEGLALSEAADLLRRRRGELGPELTVFIERSSKRARRWRLILRAAVVLFALLAAAAGFLGWQAERERRVAQANEQSANLARAAAEANLDQVLSLVDTVVEDTVGRFRDRGMPASEASALLLKVEETLKAIKVVNSDTELVQGDKIAGRAIALYSELANSYRTLGNLPAAERAARAGLKLAQIRVEIDPDNRWRHRDVGVLGNRLGEVLRDKGDLAGALASFRAGAAISAGLAARYPDDVQLQRDVSFSHQKVGETLLIAADLVGALAEFRDGRDITAKLAAADPDNGALQRDLAISHGKVGDVLLPMRDLGGALAAYREALAITEHLAALNPGNTRLKRDQSVFADRIAIVSQLSGDLDGALKAYRAGLVVAEELAASDPANFDWQRDLVSGHNSIGSILEAKKDLPAALAEYRLGLVVIEKLAASDVTNTQWQRDLSITHNRLGEVLWTQGDLTGALASYQAGLAIRRKLAAADSTNLGWQHDLWTNLTRIAAVHVVAGDMAAARAALIEARPIIVALNAARPDYPQWRDEAVWTEARLKELGVN